MKNKILGNEFFGPVVVPIASSVVKFDASINFLIVSPVGEVGEALALVNRLLTNCENNE